jgi:hypothetical protein
MLMQRHQPALQQQRQAKHFVLVQQLILAVSASVNFAFEHTNGRNGSYSFS